MQVPGIHQVFLDTLERRRLTQAHLETGDWRFAVSPDGSTLASYNMSASESRTCMSLPMRGGDPRRLSNWNASLDGLS